MKFVPVTLSTLYSYQPMRDEPITLRLRPTEGPLAGAHFDLKMDASDAGVLISQLSRYWHVEVLRRSVSSTNPVLVVPHPDGGYTHLTDTERNKLWAPVLAVETRFGADGKATSVVNHRKKTFAQRCEELRRGV